MGGRLERARERLRSTFISGLAAKIQALELAQLKLSSGDQDVVPTIMRIAHHIAGSGATFQYPALTTHARRVEGAETYEEMAAEMAALLVQLHTVVHSDTASASVLVVEDDAQLAAQFVTWLQRFGHAAAIAEDGRSARAHLSLHESDVVVLDLSLPDEDGRTLLMDLRKRYDAHRLPIIVVSAQGDQMTRDECRALGADHFLAKPVDPQVLISAVASQAERRRGLTEAGARDALTGLMTRQPFGKRFEKLHALAKRTELPLTVGIIDLDRFKDVNDTYGHATGDAVLARIASALRTTLRETDEVARWGGEEFMILFPNATTADAIAALGRVRAAVHASPMQADNGEELFITFSGGVVDVPRDASMDPVLQRADALLYVAKASGRDQVLDREPDAASSRPRVLLAEDDDAQAAMIAALLHEQGYDVNVARDGDQAILAASGEHFAMVILDAMMPGLTGFQVLERLRTTPGYRKVPILMLTALEGDADIEQAFASGVDDFLEKPFRPRQLVARVGRMLERSGGRVQRPTEPASSPGFGPHKRRRTDPT